VTREKRVDEKTRLGDILEILRRHWTV